MKFTHYKLGHVIGGTVVEVALQGNAANVRLLDQSNFNAYKAGRRHRYHGGLVRRSPIRLQVPRSGTWHVTVDMQGLRGSVRSGIRLIPAAALKPLPPVDETSLRDVPSLVRTARFGAVWHSSDSSGGPEAAATSRRNLTSGCPVVGAQRHARARAGSRYTR